MRVERPLGHRVADDKDKLGAMHVVRPFPKPALMRGGKILLAAHVLARFLEDQLLRLGEVNGWNARRHLR